jgi:chromosome partitioning protein
VIANRVKPNTIIFRTLMRFLDQMQIPVVTTLRDSQYYVYAGEQGLGLHEMNPARVHPELAAMGRVLGPGSSRASPLRCRRWRSASPEPLMGG